MYSTTPNLEASTSPRSPPPVASPTEDDKTLEVILSPLEVRFDMSLAFLLVTVVGKLLEAVKDVTEPAPKPTAAQQQPETSKPSAFKIVMDKISILFLSQLGGVADTAERALSPTRLFLQPDVLLRTVLDNLVIGVTSDGPTVETNIDLEKFSFGYAKDDIVSFDQSLQMRTSVMDKLPTAGSDISVKIIKTPKSTRSEITTLPLLVQLDLQRLDETFSWFGGLSSFLNMSSSVTSSAASMSSAKSPVTSPRKPRGVRFDTPINPNDRSAASENKVDMRVGGFHLELQGKECLVALDTSAVKMVSRESGLGVAISKAHLEGPYLNGSLARSAPIAVDVAGLRFDFLNTPTDGDLERLLELITPSKIKFDKADDEIMVDTLLRQRRKGPILRVTVDQVQARVSQIPLLACLPGLGEELARLGTVAKYLPEDDRPGLLTLAKVLDARASVELGGKIGTINSRLGTFEIAQITVPSLIAFGVHSIAVDRNGREDLISSPDISRLGTSPGPVLMVRMIGDEMEPVIKVKMRDVTIDYRVPTIMDVLGLGPEATPQDFEASLAASVANLGDQAHNALATKTTPPNIRRTDSGKTTTSKPTKVDVLFKTCMLGLNPLNQTSKLILALNDAQLTVVLPKDVEMQATFQINKADILLTDDVSRPVSKDVSGARRPRPAASDEIAELISKGFVNISFISAAKVVVKVVATGDGEKQIDVEVRDDLLVLETCADSTQTLISLANGLSPPTPPSKENKYRTKVLPMEDLLASISPEAFGKAEGLYDFDDDFPMAAQGAASDDEYDIMVGSGSIPDDDYQHQEYDVAGKLFSAGGSMMSGVSAASDKRGGGELMFGAGSSEDSDTSNDLLIEENYFVKKQDLDSTAKIWNSTRNSYDRAPSDLVRRSPVRVAVRNVHVIWNLFDGYDWVRTRDEITKTVEQVENKALERRRRREPEPDEDEDIDVIGDYLFNSIYIGIPANRDPRELAQMINQDINDNATYTETESVATTATATPSRPSGSGRSRKKLRLNRSRNHKITFELSGLNADLIMFPPGSGETQTSIDVRIYSLEVFDHIPTSTWKMFATYDKDAGERQMNTSMVRLEVLTVKPQEDLAASDIILKVSVMPLRLHVDQDALDFITRFFEFKDDKVPVHSSPSDVPFLQRVEVMDIPVQLDFKPKRVDYAGLKSGRTTEFMNFIVLDQARMTLRHTIIYGIQGFDRMGKTLNDIWMPDVKKTQLPGILGALAPIRGLVNIGSGFKELVEIPVREYQKDGRILRSLGKGAAAFARTTGTEVIKLGAKVAVGTQTALQGAEGLLTSGRAAEAEATTWDGNDPGEDFEEQRKQISLYADQPAGVLQGLRGGYASLARDLHLARDAIIAVPGEVMESGDAAGLARVMLRRAPTIVFRPAIGASKAIGKTLMGATNSLDPENRRRVEEVSHPGVLLWRNDANNHCRSTNGTECIPAAHRHSFPEASSRMGPVLSGLTHLDCIIEWTRTGEGGFFFLLFPFSYVELALEGGMLHHGHF
jgi:autophagy-related protein 2